MNRILLIIAFLVSAIGFSQTVIIPAGASAAPQQLGLSGSTLTLTGSASVDLSGFLDNQIVTDFSLVGTVLSITLENGNTVNVDLATIAGSGHTIQDEGTPLTVRSALDFQGAGVTVTDDAGNDKTIVTISGGGSGANLGYTASPTNGTVTSDSGTDATLLLATGTNAGLLAPADFTKLGTVETNAAADQSAAEVANTPSGNLVATDVQSALNELQTEIDGLGTGSIGGSIAADQIAVGASANNVEGSAGLTFNDSGLAPVLGVDATGTTTGNRAIVGIVNMNSGTEGGEFRFGDENNSIANEYGQGVAMNSFHTMVFAGGTQTLGAIDYSDSKYATDVTESHRFLVQDSKTIIVRDYDTDARTADWIRFENEDGSPIGTGIDSQGRFYGDGSQLTGVGGVTGKEIQSDATGLAGMSEIQNIVKGPKSAIDALAADPTRLDLCDNCGPMDVESVTATLNITGFHGSDDSATDTASFTIGTVYPGGVYQVIINRASAPGITGATQMPNTQAFLSNTKMALTFTVNADSTVSYTYTEL